MTEKLIKTFIKDFNEDFSCNIPSDTLGFLSDLYENFISINTSNNAEQGYLAELAELDNKINSILDENQLQLIKKFDEVKDAMVENTTKQAFVYGYCVCKLLDKMSNTIK